MSVILQTTLLLAASNVFMTFAWYAHLKDLAFLPLPKGGQEGFVENFLRGLPTSLPGQTRALINE